jgi:hypothetical protein
VNYTEVTRYFEDAISTGKHWYIALLEAVGLWTEAEEACGDRVYRYLIAGEAFDWLLLVERIYECVDGLLPHDEKEALIFNSRAPIAVSPGRFKELIGSHKYHQYLNYFYGVIVEEALLQAVREEVRKEKWAAGFYEEQDCLAEAYQRIYRDTQMDLLSRFRKERRYPQRLSISLSELKEFTYWLFKYRLAVCDKAKVASDTKKALDWLKSQGANLLPEQGQS